MALLKGDFVSVTFKMHGHNVVDVICEVIKHTAVGVEFKSPTKEQGNCGTPGAPWNLPFKAEYLKEHLPELPLGSTTYITGFMSAYKKGIHPNTRGLAGIVKGHGETGEIRVGSWWYPRSSLSHNPLALGQIADVPVNMMAVKTKPDPKYKCINSERSPS